MSLPRRVASLLLAALALVAAAARAANPELPGPPAGARVVYALDLRTELATTAGNLLEQSAKPAARPAEVTMTARLRGRLSFTTLEIGPERRIVALHVAAPQVEVTSGGAPDPARSAALREALARVSAAALTPAGRVAWAWIDRASDPVSAGFVRSILAATQVTRPDDGRMTAPRWEAEEEDPSGRYLSRYERAGAPAQGRVVLRRTRLRHLADADEADEGTIAPAILPSGSATLTLDARDGTLLSLRADERQKVLVNDRLLARVRQRVTLDVVSREQADASALAEARTAADVLRREDAAPLHVVPSREETQAVMNQAQLGELTADELVARLETVEAGGPQARRQARTELFLKLRALAALRPEACPRLGALLAAARPGSLALEILPLALREAGTDAAQDALVAVLRRRSGDREVASAVVAALAGFRRPGAAAQESLASLAFQGGADRDLAMRAQLALGAQAKVLARSAPERADALVRDLLSALSRATSPQDTGVLLLALGNAGSPVALPALGAHAQDPDPELRGAALSALRFIAAPEADALLVKALEGDGDAGVRARVASAFAFRKLTPAAVRAHRAVLASKAPDSLRIAVLENLWRVRGEVAEARRLVARAARDPAKDVREAAKRLLAEERASR